MSIAQGPGRSRESAVPANPFEEAESQCSTSKPAADPDTIDALLRERDALRELLADAIAEIDDWAAYAAPAFREKHDLDGTLSRFRAALAATEVK